MKLKITFLLVLFFYGASIFSQNVFPENNAVWKINSTTIAGPMVGHQSLCGDTLIDGINYGKLFSLQLDSVMNIIDEIYLGGIRSEGELVYYFPENNNDEMLLYDFSLEAGDSIDLLPLYLMNPVTRYVDSVKMEMLAGEMRKVIYFRPGYMGAPVEFWIEGVGSSYGPIGRASDPGFDSGMQLLCFAHDSEYLNLTLIECFLPELSDCPIINSADEKNKINYSLYPNPTYGIIHIEIKNGGTGDLSFDLFHSDGRLTKRFFRKQNEFIQLEINDLNSGVYFLEMKNKETGEQISTWKIIKL